MVFCSPLRTAALVQSSEFLTDPVLVPVLVLVLPEKGQMTGQDQTLQHYLAGSRELLCSLECLVLCFLPLKGTAKSSLVFQERGSYRVGQCH